MQFPQCLEHIQRVAPEAADGFSEDQVDLSLSATVQH